MNKHRKKHAFSEVMTVHGPECYLNREISWLSFNTRVLEEADNTANPLLERVRFLSISATNLDEFNMVRVAGLRGQVSAGINEISQDGLLPKEQLAAVLKCEYELVRRQDACWLRLRQELHDNGIKVILADALRDAERAWLKEHFLRNIFPLLTPIAIDPAHPFPFIPNRGVAMMLLLMSERNNKTMKGLFLLPPRMERFIALPGKETRFILAETVIEMFYHILFPECQLLSQGIFRILRDSDMEIDEEAEDLVRTFESALKRRRRGRVILMMYNDTMPEELLDTVMEQADVSPSSALGVSSMLGLKDVKQLIIDDRSDLLYAPFTPRFPKRIKDYGGDIFAAIRQKDLIVHHPFEPFDVVIRFVQQAARDPDVVAIKQTLYRTSNNSPIVSALIEAAEGGKSVTAMVELNARFDEEANIRWARDLERAGAQVVFGFIDKKTHAKVNMVVRREGASLRSYVHFGTGNYHPVTARVYTDLSFFTTDPALCRDAARLFNYMTGYAYPGTLDKLSYAPDTLKDTICDLIETEIANAESGKPAAIWLKINALVYAGMIDSLYRASMAGVSVDLVVRGICCLRPGIPGLSENIRVKSIVGRYLEHARIYCFANGTALPSKDSKVFIASADLMHRNLYRRLETLVPIENETVKQQVLNEIMVSNLKDKRQSWLMDQDGNYTRVPIAQDEEAFSAHHYFMTKPSLSGQGQTRKKP